MARLSVSLSGAGGKYAILAPFRASGMYALALFFSGYCDGYKRVSCAKWKVEREFFGYPGLQNDSTVWYAVSFRLDEKRRFTQSTASLAAAFSDDRRMPSRRHEEEKVLIPSRDKFSDFKIATFW